MIDNFSVNKIRTLSLSIRDLNACKCWSVCQPKHSWFDVTNFLLWILLCYVIQYKYMYPFFIHLMTRWQSTAATPWFTCVYMVNKSIKRERKISGCTPDSNFVFNYALICKCILRIKLQCLRSSFVTFE